MTEMPIFEMIFKQASLDRFLVVLHNLAER